MSTARAFYEAGVEAYRAGNQQRAGELLKESLEMDKSNPYAWLWYARTIKNPQKALRYVDRAIKLDPDNTTARKMKKKLKTRKSSKPKVAKQQFPQTPGKRLIVIKTRMSQHIIHLLIAVVAGIMAAGFGYVAYTGTLIEQYANQDAAKITIGGLALVFACGVPLYLYEIIATFGSRFVLYENGFSLSTRKNARYYLWQDLDSIKFRDKIEVVRYRTRTGAVIEIGHEAKYKVVLSYKGRAIFTLSRNYHHFRRVGDEIMDRAIPVLAKKYAMQLANGEKIQLARINIDANGIYKGNKLMRWEDINYTQVVAPDDDESDNCQYVVYLKSGEHFIWGRNSAEPNLYVLPQLTHIILMQMTGSW